ncbi:hypothetical protein, partial [Mycoplasmopsis arginini]|uniref:hypothetical protein n=1 Tax=Mycoplasmopsis arginini TaxID=2094 RepID=UPI00249DB665
AGITPVEAIKICNQESWGGFKAVWLNKQGNVTKFKTKAERISDNNEKAANEFLNSSNEKIIEGEVLHAWFSKTWFYGLDESFNVTLPARSKCWCASFVVGFTSEIWV